MPTPTDERSPREEPSGGRTLGLGGLLIELVLPLAVSAALLLLLAGYTSRWDLRTPVGSGVFGFLLVALSLFLSHRLDALTLARRRRMGKRQLLNRASPRPRLVKLILGGLVIPIAAFAAASGLELPGHQTPMAQASLAIRSTLAGPEVARAAQLGEAVRRAPDPTARVQGILALQSAGSSEALDQLLRILSDDPTALKNGGEAASLARALASYGVQAKRRLMERFNQLSPTGHERETGPPGELFDRYFSAGFEGLDREIDNRGPDPAVQAKERERLRAAAAELKETLSRLEGDSLADPDGSRLPSFILQTFLQMGLKQDAELLAFARRTAADAAWSDTVRGQALLLIAKLGGKDDLDELYGYLGRPSARLQARALQAIAVLQSRLSAAGAGS